MKNKKNDPKRFKLSRDIDIGSPDAETDSILMDVFLVSDALTSLMKIDNQKSIIIGRTGSGKSALLRYIEQNKHKVVSLQPEAMSLRFLCNSTILTYFRGLDVNLNFFYKVLWKHVFMVELLKLYFGDDIFRKQNWIQNLTEKLTRSGKNNPRKERAIRYLTVWSKDFWLDTEKRVKELENKIEKQFLHETGIKFGDLIKFTSSEKDTNESKSVLEFKYKAEKIISESQAEELFEVITIMKEELFIDRQKQYYLLIDDLDKEWIPTEIRYELIGAMIEVIKDFQILQGVKIVIALRENLYQIVLSGLQHKGGQREKFKPLYVNLAWSKEELEQLVNQRLELVTENNLSLKDAFERQYSNNHSGFDYMLERTFYRPRDVISFINHAIENASNKAYFTLDIIKKAEVYYSIDRLQAIEDEWSENYGDISDLYSFLIGRYNGFRLRNLKEDDFISLLIGDNPDSKYKGELLTIIKRYRDQGVKFTIIVKELVYLLYQMGIIGIKKGPTYPIWFYYHREAQLSISDLNNDCKVYVHKAFYSVLKINTKEQEADVY
jgi:hypothetical protein